MRFGPDHMAVHNAPLAYHPVVEVMPYLDGSEAELEDPLRKWEASGFRRHSRNL